MPASPASARAPRSRRPVLDAVAAGAVDLARAAAVEVAPPGTVGEHLGAALEGERLVAHRFASTAPGYRGWVWTVVVARAPRARSATVSEVALLPAQDAVLSPAWLPWADRLAPGDLGPHDVLPRVADDPRLEQGYEATGDQEVDEVALWELGLGRARVLSVVGRDDAADRWYAGAAGPQAESARAAAAPCASCGFYQRLAGPLAAVFGVCANEWSPDDGRVVSRDHGCGAHSETDVAADPEPTSSPVVDETDYESVSLRD